MTNTVPPALSVTPTLPVLTFNFEQLKAWALGVAEHYSGLIVTEDGVAEAKRDMAEINKAKAAVDAARKETVRQVSEPIRAFETQVKEVCGIFDQAYAKLSEQVKAFEDKQRQEKRDKVLELIEQCLSDAFGPRDGRPAVNIAVQEKWVNKTTSLKSVKEDIGAIIQRYNEEEKRRADLEQARKDRAIAIENQVSALNEKHGLNIPVANFLGLIGGNTPLQDALECVRKTFALETERKEQAEAEARQKAPAPAAPTAPSKPEAKQGAAAPEAKIQAMSIVLEYSTAREKEVQACLATLKSLCASYGARYR